MGLFGSINRALFGGSKSESKNLAYGDIKGAYGPAMGYTAQAGDAVSKFLGGDTTGFQNYKDATGFDFTSREGGKGILSLGAASGLLRSGPSSKALVRYGNEIENTFADSYLARLLGLGQLGLGAGGLVTSAGQVSKGNQSTGGLGSAIGSLFAAFSDRRLKTDIVKLYEEADGLGRYRYRYFWEDRPRIGVMADEVAQLRPWALGPEFAGFRSVRYDLLEAA